MRIRGRWMLIRCSDKHRTTQIQGSNSMTHRSSPSYPCFAALPDALRRGSKQSLKAIEACNEVGRHEDAHQMQ